MKRTLTDLRGTKRPSPAVRDEIVASVLVFLAADDERFDRFQALTGLDVTQLRAVAGTRGFAESIVDYLCSDEPLLLAFADESGHKPADIDALRQSFVPLPFDD